MTNYQQWLTISALAGSCIVMVLYSLTGAVPFKAVVELWNVGLVGSFIGYDICRLAKTISCLHASKTLQQARPALGAITLRWIVTISMALSWCLLISVIIHGMPRVLVFLAARSFDMGMLVLLCWLGAVVRTVASQALLDGDGETPHEYGDSQIAHMNNHQRPLPIFLGLWPLTILRAIWRYSTHRRVTQ